MSETRDYKQVMKDSLPGYYEKSELVNDIVDSEAEELQAVADTLFDVLIQGFVDTATWGLDKWEKIFGITTNPAMSYEDRRLFLKSKMRGSGVVNKETLLNVIEPFGVGKSIVTEVFDEYRIDIMFVGTRGMPDNLEDIEAALKVFIPAHLGLGYTYTYVTMEELGTETWDTLQFKSDATNRTWDEVETSFFV